MSSRPTEITESADARIATPAAAKRIAAPAVARIAAATGATAAHAAAAARFAALLVAMIALAVGVVACGTGGEEDAVSPEPSAPPEDAPHVVIQTSHGDIVVALYAERVPATVENFLQYVDDGFYAGTVFHRVIPGFMVQGGGLTPDLERKPVRDPIRNEAIDSGLKNLRGTVAMARQNDPDTATSQFYINLVDNASLDPGAGSEAGYAVFGEVVEGMGVVDRIAEVPTGRQGGRSDVPLEQVTIEEVRRISPPGGS